MSVFRVEKNSNYTVMANYHLRDKRLSFRARGLLSTILSLPDDWDYSVNGLVTLAKDGYDSVKSTLKELEQNGYLVRTRARKGHGHLGSMIYTIYEEPQLAEGSPTEGCPTQVKPTEVNPGQISKDITNIKKEPNTEETKEACLLATSRAREDAVDDLVRYITDQIGRSLSNIERRTCIGWIEQGVESELIQIALEDNLYRDRFNLCYVDETLNRWKEQGITDPRDAKNSILDNHVRNVSNMAAEIACRKYDDDLAEKIIQNNTTADLQGTRDYIIELYQEGRRDSAVNMIRNTYHKEILDYLPKEIVEYYEAHKDEE